MSHPPAMIESMDTLPPFTFLIGALGTLATACTWTGLRRWADHADSTRALLTIAVVLWMPNVWTRWVQQEAESITNHLQDHIAAPFTAAVAPTPTTIPK